MRPTHRRTVPSLQPRLSAQRIQIGRFPRFHSHRHTLGSAQVFAFYDDALAVPTEKEPMVAAIRIDFCDMTRHTTPRPQTNAAQQQRAELWRITPNLPPRTSQVISASSQISCGDLLRSRTLKSRQNSTLRNERRSGRPLPALLPQRIRKPFLPPCQSPLHRSIASLQSERVPA